MPHYPSSSPPLRSHARRPAVPILPVHCRRGRSCSRRRILIYAPFSRLGRSHATSHLHVVPLRASMRSDLGEEGLPPPLMWVRERRGALPLAWVRRGRGGNPKSAICTVPWKWAVRAFLGLDILGDEAYKASTSENRFTETNTLKRPSLKNRLFLEMLVLKCLSL